MTTTPKPEPASDAEIERILTYIRLSPRGRDTIKRRIEADRARIRELEDAIVRHAGEEDDSDHLDGMARAYLALRAENEELKTGSYSDQAFETLAKDNNTLRAENERLKALEDGDVLDCEVCRHFVIRGRGCEVCRLRAQLAEKEREIAADNLDLATERAARERVEKERDKFEAESEQKGADLMAAEGVIAEIIDAHERSASSEIGQLIEDARAARAKEGEPGR